MPWAVAAAAITAGGAIISSNKQSKAVDKAAKASTDATDKILKLGEPYRNAGQMGINALQDPNKFFYASPGYNWRLGQGMEAVSQNRAVNGMLKSGGTLKALSDYAQNQASGEFGNWWNQNFNLGQMGLRATGLGGDAISTNAANQGNAALQQGNIQAGTIGSITDILGGVLTKYGGTGGSNSSYGPVSGGGFGGAGYSDLPVYG